MRRTIATTIVLILIHGSAIAADTVKATIVKYLDYDLLGKRLSSKTSKDIDDITANQYEPAWDIVTIATGYKIGSITSSDNSAKAIIIFVNSWDMSQDMVRKNIIKETIEINLEKLEGVWKVGPPYYQPHVLPSVIIKHLNGLIKDYSKDPQRNKDYLSHTSNEINAVTKYIEAIQ
jgi:hypothetical protein